MIVQQQREGERMKVRKRDHRLSLKRKYIIIIKYSLLFTFMLVT